MPEGYKIRRAIRSDSEKIWEIRNAPASRSVSHNQEAIPFASHDVWFIQKYFESDEHRCYVLTYNNEVCGYCRIDKGLDKSVFVVSIALHPSYHGKGLGQFFLKEVIAQFDLSGDMEADISKVNTPSLKLFEECGFTKVREDGSYIYYRLERK